MPRTLLICGHYPLPEHTGANMRTMNFVRFFRQRGPVDIAYSHVLPEAQTGSPIFASEYRLSIRRHTSFKTQLLHRFIARIPSPIYQFTRESQRLLLTLIASTDYDHILVRYIHSAAYLRSLASVYASRILLDFDDVVSDSLQDSLYGSPQTRVALILHRWNMRRLKIYEKQCLRFGASLFSSEQDKREMLRGAHNPNAFVVPNVYSNPSFATYDFGDGFRVGHSLLFVGTLSYAPNVEGLTWFIRSIFPTFIEAYPDAKLVLVGRSPCRAVKAICANRADIELHSNVPDVRPYLARARAVVVPLLAGGGTRIKILEAALARRPVLATPLGAQGLELTHGRDILLFSDAREFAVHYSMLQRQERYESLVRSAQEHVVTRHSVQAFDIAVKQVLTAMEASAKPLVEAR